MAASTSDGTAGTMPTLMVAGSNAPMPKSRTYASLPVETRRRVVEQCINLTADVAEHFYEDCQLRARMARARNRLEEYIVGAGEG